jgi:hypothetical protein
MENIKTSIQLLKEMKEWSDRIGSDEHYQINEIVKMLESSKYYTLKDMEKSFVAGGKLSRNIENDGFNEFIEKLNK